MRSSMATLLLVSVACATGPAWREPWLEGTDVHDVLRATAEAISEREDFALYHARRSCDRELEDGCARGGLDVSASDGSAACHPAGEGVFRCRVTCSGVCVVPTCCGLGDFPNDD